MKTRQSLIVSVVVTLAALVTLALFTQLTQAQGPGPGVQPQGAADVAAPEAAVSAIIPIQGRLTDASGNPINGTRSITFSLYSASSGGTALCQDNDPVGVDNGLFNANIDYCTDSDINGQPLWLGVQVEGDAEMNSRQPIYPVPYARSLRPGAIISDTQNDAILHIENWGVSGRGLRAYAMSTTGTNYGVVGASRSPDGYGGYFYNNGGGDGLWAESTSATGGDGVQGETASTSGRGVYAANNANGTALAAYSDSPSTTLHLYPTLYLVQADSSGDFVVGASSYYGTRYWRVDRTGKGFFNGGTQASGADFAEQISVQGNEKDYEPGDVLVISSQADRAVELSAQPFATAVIGVYSTQPAVLAGAPDKDDPLSGVPVAITGIVPCKVSAENGAIRRGDLLVTSSLPGYAMRAGSNPPQGTVLGKSLGELKDGTGILQVLVTLQ
jgi:hypothetical protein